MIYVRLDWEFESLPFCFSFCCVRIRWNGFHIYTTSDMVMFSHWPMAFSDGWVANFGYF